MPPFLRVCAVKPDVLTDSQMREYAIPLTQIGDGFLAENGGRIPTGDVVFFQDNLALLVGSQIEQSLDERGFTGPVQTRHTDGLTRLQFKGHLLEKKLVMGISGRIILNAKHPYPRKTIVYS